MPFFKYLGKIYYEGVILLAGILPKNKNEYLKQIGLDPRIYKEALAIIMGGKKGKPSAEQELEAENLTYRMMERHKKNEAKKKARSVSILDKSQAMAEIKVSKYFKDYKQRKGMSNTDIVKQMILFTAAYAQFGMLKDAETFVGLSTNDRKEWAKECPAFATALDFAKEDFIDDLESVAIKRAKEKSDTLLTFLLKAYRPEKFKDKVAMDAHVNSHGGVTLNFAEGLFSPEEMRRMKSMNEQKDEPSKGVVN